MQITYTPKKVIVFLAAIICMLLLAHLAGMVAYYYFNHTSSYYTIEFFRLAADTNFPTYFSSAQLLFCAIMLALIANLRKKQGGQDVGQWLGLSFIMLFLSIDEAIMIHELIAEHIRETYNTTGMLYFAWVIPYSVFALVVGIAYIPFLLRLPQVVKALMIFAGIVFVAGALGLEVLESHYFTLNGNKKSFVLTLFTTAEEIMEMGGILVFLYSLFYYIDHEFGGISISITSKTTAPAPTEKQAEEYPATSLKPEAPKLQEV